MIRDRIGRYVDRSRRAIRKTVAEEYTSRELAGSFALGTFITMLPTLGTGLLLFVVIALAFDRINKIALFASVVVFNPMVKWGVYVASFSLGVQLLGPVEGAHFGAVSLGAAPDIVVRLLLGNFILASIAAVSSYVVIYRLSVAYGTTDVGERIDDDVEDFVDEVLEERV